MIQIINGLRYDTDKAKKLGDATTTNSSQGDTTYWSASLYQTASGRFFLAGSGGAATCWGRVTERGGRLAGEGILPLTPEEATSWAENHLSLNETEAAFGDEIKDA